MDVTDLTVYQLSFNLLDELTLIRIICRDQDLLRQLFKSARSVPTQIAEGFAKRSSQKEFVRFLYIALGSSDETISHLRVIYRMTKDERITGLGLKYKSLSKQINSLIQTIKNNPKSDI